MPRCITHCTQFSFFVPFLCFTSWRDTCSCTAVVYSFLPPSFSLFLSSANRYNATFFSEDSIFAFLVHIYVPSPLARSTNPFFQFRRDTVCLLLFSLSLFFFHLLWNRGAFAKHDVSKETRMRARQNNRTRIRKARLIGGNKCEFAGDMEIAVNRVFRVLWESKFPAKLPVNDDNFSFRTPFPRESSSRGKKGKKKGKIK